MTGNRWFAWACLTLTGLLMAAFLTAAEPVVVARVAAAPALAPPQAAGRQAPAPQPAVQAGYVGEKTCMTCHDQSYKGTKHALTFNERTPAATHGCESCHGPGQKHAESGDPDLIQRFSKMSA